jgi:indole-3-glycerol phosphate synthase
MILDDIVSFKRREVRRDQEIRKIQDLKAKARNAPPPKPFELRRKGEVSVIAEIKRASPAKGLLKPDLDPADQALRYREGGAAAISCLTDREFFKGSVEDFRAARNAAGLPMLRKDFVVDDYQLWEARVMLADCVLLIVRILDQAQLRDYLALAREELGLAVLTEVHDERELERALDAGAPVIGINNRDLDTFKVSLETTARLRTLIPPGRVVVSESGISRREDLVLLKAMGADAALIGEELVKASDPAAKLKELRGA